MGQVRIYDFFFADDTALMAESEEKLCRCKCRSLVERSTDGSCELMWVKAK